MAAGPSPLAVVCLLLATAVALLLAASSSSASPVAAAGNHGGGRMAIIIRAPGARVAAAAASGGARSKWQHDRRRLVEDEVAPEFGGLLGAGRISTNPLINDRAACTSYCAGKGAPYTRPCIYKNQCNG